MTISGADKVKQMIEFWEKKHADEATFEKMIFALEETSPLTKRMIQVLKK